MSIHRPLADAALATDASLWRHWLLMLCITVAGLTNADSVVAWDDGIAIVVNVESSLNTVSSDELINVFLGRSRQLSNGVAVVPLDQMDGSSTRSEFYERVINKTESQMNSYWSRLIFSGKGRPPYAVSDDQEVLELIAVNRNMLGYVRSSAVTPQVKVILMVPAEQP